MAAPIAKISKPSKLTQTIAERLRTMIVEGALKPGERLPTEKELCKGFGVGRSSVREALQSLEHVGLLRSRPGVGRFLTEDAFLLLQSQNWWQMMERASQFEWMDARMIIEVSVARLAAERATPDDVRYLGEALKGMEGSVGNLDRFFEIELEAHLCVAKACGNKILTELVGYLIQRISGEAEKFLRTLPYTATRTLEDFRNILRAFQNKDGALAGDAMEKHLRGISDVLAKGHEAGRLS